MAIAFAKRGSRVNTATSAHLDIEGFQNVFIVLVTLLEFSTLIVKEIAFVKYVFKLTTP